MNRFKPLISFKNTNQLQNKIDYNILPSWVICYVCLNIYNVIVKIIVT